MYCLLWKTPIQMSSVKWYLVTMHVWIMYFDYTWGLLVVPFFLFPAVAMYPLGVLSYIGIPAVLQVILFILAMTYINISTTSIFENRFYTLCMFSWKHNWTVCRRPWLAFNYIIVTIAMIPLGLSVPDQISSRKRVFETLPCQPRYIYEAPVFVLANDYTIHIVFVLAFVFFITIQIFIFLVFLVWNTVQQVKSKTMSSKTFEMQKKFFLTLVIQMEVPLFLFLTPLIYVLISATRNYYNQSATNIAVITASTNGIVSTLVMVFIHRPYREVVFALFRRSRISEVSQIRVATPRSAITIVTT
ncbi:hypothetical protein GCK72_020223 [Caenorhabditis remanei]|uniref:Uncharacterized protein n=1 Tax=Caenorhabditis remanei TaxID=31234 RepID=A0A6A5GG28_CAERE|nr:hypothetical protein GCK72_020223 [Caenorhabditis remanei]KAF1753666.1 hypothetical protein GCK72_020223 [Caenorhabditis remanei]